MLFRTLRRGTPGNCSNDGEVLEHPGGIKAELRNWNISSLSKNYPLKKHNIRDSTVEVFKKSGCSHHTNEGLKYSSDRTPL